MRGPRCAIADRPRRGSIARRRRIQGRGATGLPSLGYLPVDQAVHLLVRAEVTGNYLLRIGRLFRVPPRHWAEREPEERSAGWQQVQVDHDAHEADDDEHWAPCGEASRVQHGKLYRQGYKAHLEEQRAEIPHRFGQDAGNVADVVTDHVHLRVVSRLEPDH
jgi:hypothetical protein